MSGLRRAARDAWILDGLLFRSENRPGASITFVVPRRTATGDPLRPSRYLLRVARAELPERVAHLFPAEGKPGRATTKNAAPTPPVQASGILGGAVFPVLPAIPAAAPDTVGSIDSISVTALKAYLTCPYLFQLRHDPRLRLRVTDEDGTELNALVFGNLLHWVLERWGRAEVARGVPTTDADAIAAELDAALDTIAAEHFPSSASAAVRLQLELARRRLKRFAQLQAAEAQAGWRIHAVEMSFAKDVKDGSNTALQFPDANGLRLVGRIDRVDVHRSGAYRALDYKTGVDAASPRAVHLRTKKATGLEAEDWIDLQLPLYRVLLRSLPCPIHVDGWSLGYVNLAPSAEKTGFLYLECDDAAFDVAEARARDVVASIRAGDFSPALRSPVQSNDPLAPIWGIGLRVDAHKNMDMHAQTGALSVGGDA